jgi:hypothetical protein
VEFEAALKLAVGFGPAQLDLAEILIQCGNVALPRHFLSEHCGMLKGGTYRSARESKDADKEGPPKLDAAKPAVTTNPVEIAKSKPAKPASLFGKPHPTEFKPCFVR